MRELGVFPGVTWSKLGGRVRGHDRKPEVSSHALGGNSGESAWEGSGRDKEHAHRVWPLGLVAAARNRRLTRPPGQRPTHRILSDGRGPQRELGVFPVFCGCHVIQTWWACSWAAGSQTPRSGRKQRRKSGGHVITWPAWEGSGRDKEHAHRVWPLGVVAPCGRGKPPFSDRDRVRRN